MKDERAHLQLFDLIAREWTLPSPAGQVVFNAAGSAVAFACADGSVHLVATADKSAPNSRIRRAVDTARLTIAPRDKPYAAPKVAEFTEGRTTSVVPHGPVNFAFGKGSGRINTLTPGGIAVHLPVKAPSPIEALATAPEGETVAHACGSTIQLSTPTAENFATLQAAGPVAALAFSPDGLTLAAAHAGGVSRWAVATPDKGPLITPMAAAPESIAWRADGRWLVCCLGEGGISVIEAATDEVRPYDNFPAPARTAAFSAPTDTVLASGAFRVVAWSLDGSGGAIASGKPGLVLVEAIAVSPNRSLVAVGYANGLLSLAEIGRPDEMLLREDTGAGITALAWSADGNFLALAGADGSAALVEFPDSMFKS